MDGGTGSTGFISTSWPMVATVIQCAASVERRNEAEMKGNEIKRLIQTSTEVQRIGLRCCVSAYGKLLARGRAISHYARM